MREIRFRAWDGEVMYEVTWMDLKDGKVFLVEGYAVGGSAKGSLHQSEIKAIRQYTGLHDCNDKEIWEGDIVQWDASGKIYIQVVRWVDDRAMFLPNDMKDEVEIIGNCYETPELIKP